MAAVDHNLALSLALKEAKAGARPSVTLQELSERTGIGQSTVNRIFSANPPDIRFSWMTALADALGTTPQAVVARAVAKAEEMNGGEPLFAARTEPSVGATGNNVSRFPKHPRDMSPEELEASGIARAAKRGDAESEGDEQYD